MNIVILGRFSPPVLACIRSWGRRGHQVGFIWVEGNSFRLKPRSRFLTESIRLSPSLLYTNQGAHAIETFLERFQAKVLTCVDDNLACWLNDSSEQFSSGLFLALPSSPLIRKMLSKTFQNRLALQAGLLVLDEYVVDAKNQENPDVDVDAFPLCLRPSEPDHVLPYFKVMLIQTPEELQKFARMIRFKENGKIVGQPFQNFPNLIVHGIRTVDGGIRHLFPFIVERKFEGVTLTLRAYPDIDSALLEKCRKFVDLAGLVGPFHFEFLFDPDTGKAYFLENNVRFGGTTAKVVAIGYDEPLYMLEAYGLDKPPFPAKIRESTVSNKQALLKYMGRACFQKLTALDFPEGTIKEKLWAGMKGFFFFCDEILSQDDMKGGLTLYLSNMFEMFL